MSDSRRDFLKKGTLVGLGALVPFRLAQPVSAQQNVLGSASGFALTKATFRAQLNTEFIIHGPSTVSARLVDVVDLTANKKKTVSGGKEAFSLLFRSDAEPALDQSTYVIEHETLGQFSFLLVPMMSRTIPGNVYEAVINRLYP